jgi:hypothetical protein
MNIVDKVLTEWAYRCKKGYPDMNNPDDMKILKEIYSEYGIVTEEKKEKVTDKGNKSNATDVEVTYLREVFNSIKEDYAKYLKVFMLFDPNSLGTISEVLLTKLLAEQGIETQHTGGAQGLTDLIVNGYNISLKTTSGDTKIGLGSEKEVMDSRAVELANHFKAHPELSTVTVGELSTLENAKKYYPDIIARIDAVAKKLAGPGNNEFFVWVEKTVDKKTGLLQRITIHTLKYDYSEIMNTFKQGRIIPTKGAGSKSGWNLVDNEGNPLIVADIKSKYLNISPSFIRRSTGEDIVSVEFPTIEQNKVGMSKLVSKGMFDALDNIYTQIYGSGN